MNRNDNWPSVQELIHKLLWAKNYYRKREPWFTVSKGPYNWKYSLEIDVKAAEFGLIKKIKSRSKPKTAVSKCSSKCSSSCRSVTLLKRDSNTGVFLCYLRNF